MKALVLTVSDRVSKGQREDTSGALGAQLLTAAGFAVSTAVVSDDAEAIRGALLASVSDGADVIVTTGGTGLSPRDVTPEATSTVIERPAPGLADLVRRSGSVPTAVLSRGVAGIVGRTLVINLAGSPGAVQEGLDALLPLLPHAVDQLHGGDH
ncbi:MAG TPA: MogA/MoaB family molybdenum cofactor biosynthesis protein [Mycobacteriales bacterium]|nr:MogA/MoaB family molybdenum cofactor biosynthesis protein [Mycobacteriales bacterium]